MPYIYTNAQYNSKVAEIASLKAQLAGGSSGGGSTTSNKIVTAAGTIDASGIIYRTGKEICSQYPYRASGYQYVIWSGNYTKNSLPTSYTNFTGTAIYANWTSTNQKTGLMGRLAGAEDLGDSNYYCIIRWFNSSGAERNISELHPGSGATGDSTFTLAPLVS